MCCRFAICLFARNKPFAPVQQGSCNLVIYISQGRGEKGRRLITYPGMGKAAGNVGGGSGAAAAGTSHTCLGRPRAFRCTHTALKCIAIVMLYYRTTIQAVSSIQKTLDLIKIAQETSVLCVDRSRSTVRFHIGSNQY